MNPFHALATFELEPAPAPLRRTAALLRAGGFRPTAYYVDELNTCIEIDCAPEHLSAESHRLHVYLWSLGIAAYRRACEGTDTDEEPYIAVEAVYAPADREATLEVWGLRDSMLPTR